VDALMLCTDLPEYTFILFGNTGKTDNIGHHDGGCLFHKSKNWKLKLLSYDIISNPDCSKTYVPCER
jgi:hypothetical protein